MSYPAQNTDTEFECLVEEVKRLYDKLRLSGNFTECYESVQRVRNVFSNRRYEELFLHE